MDSKYQDRARGKAELVACAFLAVEFKLPSIDESSEEQQKDYVQEC